MEFEHSSSKNSVGAGVSTVLLTLIFTLTAFVSPTARAQVYSGSLTGVATDPSGAVVPNAQVVLTDEQKGFTFTATTDAEGRYVLRNLSPGTYSLATTAQGMRQYRRTGITLTVGQNAQADVKFELQGTTEVVSVTSAATLLSTQDASTGQVVNERFINDLPLVSRSAFDLAELAPGVTQAPGGPFGQVDSEVNFVSNGGRNSTADIVMDGASQTNQENNGGVTTSLYSPPVDAVQEFNVQQNTYSAEVGFGGNTVINVMSKSGTNRFHGSLYEFVQNSVLDSNNFFNNQNGVRISPNRQNQFGGTLGGPIRKDRTFFFMDYQGTLTRTAGTARAGVPSGAERQGDFAELCQQANGKFDSAGRCSAAAGQLWDPYTGVYNNSLGGAVRGSYIPFNNLATYMSPGNPNITGATYAIPAKPGNLIDPVAYKMMQYFPLPNLAVGAAAYNPLNNWIGARGNRRDDHIFDVKIDHRISDASTLSGRFSRDQNLGEAGNCFGNAADNCTNGPDTVHRYSSTLNFTRTLSPTFILSVVYGVSRYSQRRSGAAADFPDFNPVTTLGMPQYILTSGYVAAPNIILGNGFQSVGSQSLGSQASGILHYMLDTHHLNASFDKIWSRHEIKFGWEGRLHRISHMQVGKPEGQYNYTSSGTSQTPAANAGGNALASLMIGFPQASAGYDVPVAITTQNFAHAWFLQDNWRPTSRLTINLGLRYELTLPRTERYNRMSWIDADAVSPLQVPGLPQLTGGLVFASNGQRSPYDVDFTNVGPRAGLAYRTRGDIVIRTGYGIFYEPIKGAASGTGNGGFTGFNWTTALRLADPNNPGFPGGRLSNPFPYGIVQPPGSSQGLLTGLGLNISGPIRTWNSTPYMQTWNFGLQRVIRHVLFDVNYLGTKGTHLYFGAGGGLNSLGPWVESATAAQIAQLNSSVPNPFYGIITDIASGLSAATISQSQLQKPHPQFSGFSGPDAPLANSIYHSLQVRVEKRFARGLQLLATYVNSKSIDDSSITCGCTQWLGGTTSLQDPNKRFLERSVSQFDIPQVVQFSYVYALPLGKGKHWGGNWNPVVNAVLGGWQTNGLWRFDSGMPLMLSVSTSRALPTYGAQRPNLLHTLTRSDSNWLNQYFANPQDVVTPAAYVIGNAPREISTARAPGTRTTALSMFKQFALPRLHEGSKLEFRAEAFNALNHPQFAAPNLTVGSAAFGKVTSQANSPRHVQLGLKLYF
jgi:hypothetical protein